MKKIFIIIAFIFSLSAAIFLIYFVNLNNKYKLTFTDDYYTIISGLKNKERISIEHKETDKELFTYKDLSMENIFKNFKKDEREELKDLERYLLTDDEDNTVAIFNIAYENTYLNWSKTSASIYGIEDKTFQSIDPKVVESLNLKNDLELFDYLVALPDKKKFIEKKEIKEADYYLATYCDIVIPRVNELKTIEGDYSGYIFGLDDIYEVSIFDNDKRYILSFYGEYFNLDMIQNLISTITIKR